MRNERRTTRHRLETPRHSLRGISDYCRLHLHNANTEIHCSSRLSLFSLDIPKLLERLTDVKMRRKTAWDRTRSVLAHMPLASVEKWNDRIIAVYPNKTTIEWISSFISGDAFRLGLQLRDEPTGRRRSGQRLPVRGPGPVADHQQHPEQAAEQAKKFQAHKQPDGGGVRRIRKRWRRTGDRGGELQRDPRIREENDAAAGRGEIKAKTKQ